MANIIRIGGGGGSTPTLITKSITQNGTYLAQDDNVDGYSEVEVDVPSGSQLNLLYLLNQSQGGAWVNTDITASDYDKFVFVSSESGDEKYTVSIATADIAVYTGGADVYTTILSASQIGRDFNVRVYNDKLYISFGGTGASTKVVGVYNETSGGGGGGGEYVDLSSFTHYFARNTTTPTVTQVSTTEVALTYQDQNNSGYELSSYSIPLDKGVYVVDIYATTSAVGSQRSYYTWGIYSTENSWWAQVNGNEPMDNQAVGTYVPFVADTNEHFYEVPLKLLADGTGYICFATAGDGGVNATITVSSLKIRKVSIDG